MEDELVTLFWLQWNTMYEFLVAIIKIPKKSLKAYTLHIL